MKRLYFGVVVVMVGNDINVEPNAGCFSDEDAAHGRLVKRAMELHPTGVLMSARVYAMPDHIIREAMGYITEANGQ